MTLEQDLERDIGTDEAHERRHLGVRHHETEVLDGCSEAARHAADPQVAHRGDLEATAHANAMDLRDQRHRTVSKCAQRRVHHRAVRARLRRVRALERKLRDVVAG